MVDDLRREVLLRAVGEVTGHREVLELADLPACIDAGESTSETSTGVAVAVGDAVNVALGVAPVRVAVGVGGTTTVNSARHRWSPSW